MSDLTTVVRGATILVQLLGLGLTVWLGLVLVSMAPRRGMSWLAGALCWGFSAVFALNLLQLGRPLVPERPWLPYEILRWVLIPLPLAWLWLLSDLLPLRLRPLLRPLRRIAVVLAVVLIAVAALTRPWTLAFGVNLVSAAWIFYPLYLVTVLVTVAPTVGLTWRSARVARDPSRRDSSYALAAATVLALVSALYGVGGFWLWPGLPLLPGNLTLLGAVILLGLALVLREIADGKTNVPAFFYSLMNAGAITLLYVLVVGGAAALLGISWLVLIPVVALTVGTHWLTEWSRRLFDTVFYRAPVQRLRADLRALVRVLDRDEQLAPQLRPALARLARQTGASLVALALVEHDGPSMRIVAASPPSSEGSDLPRQPLTMAARGPVRLPQPGGERGPEPSGTPGLAPGTSGSANPAAWALPLLGGQGQLGALVAWPSPAHGFSDLDLVLFDEVGSDLALLLATWQTQSARLAEIERLVAAYREQAEALQAEVQALAADESEDAALAELATMARRWVEEGLRHLHDVAYLGQHPLAQLRAVDARVSPSAGVVVTHLERGQAVRQLLEELIERLRPPGKPPVEPYPAEWRLYTALYDAYVEGLPNREIMSRLYIGEGTFHRARRQGLESLAEALIELEQAATEGASAPASSTHNTTAPAPLPPSQ